MLGNVGLPLDDHVKGLPLKPAPKPPLLVLMTSR